MECHLVLSYLHYIYSVGVDYIKKDVNGSGFYVEDVFLDRIS